MTTPIGRVLSRREVLALLGVAGVGAVAAACTPGAQATASLIASASPAPPASASASTTAAPATAAPTGSPPSAPTATPGAAAATTALRSCIVKPALTEGPYFVDEKLNRSDIRPDPTYSDAAASKGLEFTSQLFFDDTLSDTVFAIAPYSQKNARSTRNANDGIFSDQLILDVTGDNPGYEATFEIGVQTS